MNDNEKINGPNEAPPSGAPRAADAAPPPGDAATAPAADVAAQLEARVRELESQQADLTDRLLRAHAEMENLRKRTEREKQDSAKYAISKFALDMVGIGDNFQRAVAAVPGHAREQDSAVKSLIEGVEMTERAFMQVLERHGVKPIDPMGEAFNPNLHQAVMEQEAAEVPAGTVIKVFQPGYIIEDRVLRPAMVVVSRGGARTPKPAESAGNGSPPAEPST
jgi:molecular chaperone GrpE